MTTNPKPLSPADLNASSVELDSPAAPSLEGENEGVQATEPLEQNANDATATGGGSVRKPSESTGPGEKPAVPTSGFPSDIPEEELHDEMLIIRRILAVIDAQSLAIQRKLRRKGASQSWPWTSGTRERTNG